MDALELLGSTARLRVVRALSRRDMYVSELMETVGMDGKTATHHLDALEGRGLVESYREGRRRYYSLVREVRLEVSPPPNRRFVVQFPPADATEGDGAGADDTDSGSAPTDATPEP